MATGQQVPSGAKGMTKLTTNEGQYRNTDGAIENMKQGDPQNNYNQGNEKQQNLNIVNNIMHINHSGANINIVCGNNVDPQKDGHQQNNFIFNHTAPINLNFYEEGKKKDSTHINATVM